MALLKKQDYVEIEYTGRTKDDNSVFDTTSEKVARENNLYDEHSKYRSLVICLGGSHLLKGLEEQIIGKETGKEYEFEIGHEQAFGRKDARLIRMVPIGKFKEHKIQPVPGLHLNIDGVFGIVKTASGGRCLVDFNHPLSGKDLRYSIKIGRIIEDDAEKIKSILSYHLGVEDAKLEIKDGKAEISLKNKLAGEMQHHLNHEITSTIKSIQEVVFTISEEIK